MQPSNGKRANGGATAVVVKIESHTSSLSFSPVVMAFKDVCYFVPQPKGSGA